MKFLEKDLEQIIWENLKTQDGCRLLYDKGLKIVHDKHDFEFSQLNIGNYGRLDLLTASRTSPCGTEYQINLYELKKDKISVSAFLQAVGYLKGISRYLEVRYPDYYFSFGIILIGSSIDKNGSACFLPEVISSDQFFLAHYTYSYDINGIRFNPEENYKMINEGFKFPKKINKSDIPF